MESGSFWPVIIPVSDEAGLAIAYEGQKLAIGFFRHESGGVGVTDWQIDMITPTEGEIDHIHFDKPDLIVAYKDLALLFAGIGDVESG